MYIARLRIKNFRSLVDVEIEPSNYTVLVGTNDCGKSNVLRALNLFFNNQTDVGESLAFNTDYSQSAPVKKGKAREIEVEVEFQPPKNYTDNDRVVWRKTWREGSVAPYSDELKMLGGKKFSPRSKTEYWVRQIGYEYVPAIRGKEFFATLKRRLHNTLAETIAPRLAAASGGFLGNIRKEVGKIEKEARRLFDLTTEFSLPSDLGSLFEILDLKTADSHASTPLQNRGDGIQGRHIPVILRFLAEQRKINYAHGKPPPETIWGYEEPENNLELAKQIEESEEFYRSSSAIQVLLTTHSPAFYGVTNSQEQAVSWFARRAEGVTQFQPFASRELLDEGLGLMPFVSPYLNLARRQRAEMLEQIKSLRAQSLHGEKSILCVEGITDKTILDAVLKAKYGANLPFEIVAKPGMGAGVGWAVGYATARAVMPDLAMKTAILFDADQAGVEARTLLESQLDAIKRRDRVRIFMIGKSNGDDEIRAVMKAGFNISLALEEICGTAAWDHAEEKGWLELRDDVVAKNAKILNADTSFSELVNQKLPQEACRRLVRMRVSGEKKNKFSKFFSDSIASEAPLLPTLDLLVEEIYRYFTKDSGK